MISLSRWHDFGIAFEKDRKTMVHLDLTDDEARLLAEFIESTLSNLSYEIRDTDTKEFRDALKTKRDVLVKVKEALASAID